MRSSGSILHIEPKRALIIMLIFAVLLSVIGLLTGVALETSCAHLSSLFRSNYTYSATTSNALFKDDYYRFTAGISFSASRNTRAALNADILMQTSESKYTHAIDWNTGTLNSQQVAITAGIANSNNLIVGEKIYSKHIVDGTIHEYIICSILPELSGATVSKDGIATEGIILMGEDKQYVENVSHISLIFSDMSIEELAEKTSGIPSNVLYRTDEIISVSIRLLPYVVLFDLLSILSTIAFVRSLTKIAAFNYKRLVILGYEKTKLNQAYKKWVLGVGFVAILISLIIVISISQLFLFSPVLTFVWCFLLLTESATLLVSFWLSRRKLWR